MSTTYYKFLCACLRGESTTARALAETPGWNWERVFDEANREAVLPGISLALRDRLSVAIPPGVADFLSAVVALNRERNAVFLSEVKIVAGLLNKVGIEPVLLKGAAYLAADVYADLAERYLGDIDILVSEGNIQAAVEALTTNGFTQDDSDRFGRFRHHHPPLCRIARQGAPIWIEIHHRIGTTACASLLPAEEIIAESLAYSFTSAHVRVPCPEHLMMHLVLHSQLLHPYNERIWPPLRALCDLRRLQNRFAGVIAWPDLFKRFRKAGQYGIIAMHLEDAHDSLGIVVPAGSRISGFTRLRRSRRRLLRRWPQLRYLDPIYMFSTGCTRRLRILSAVLKKPDEWKYFVSQLSRGDVYKSFLTDVVQGRGH